MSPLYEAWWKATMDARGVLRFFAERFPWSRSIGVRLRWLLHLWVGNPIQTIGFFLTLLFLLAGFPLVIASLLLFVPWSIFEGWYRLRFDSGPWLVAWREAWRFRRRWPSEWAGVAAKTSAVQAEVGTSDEPIASASLRPVVDHPKLSMIPRMEFPVISWWVGPPPGRSLVTLAEVEVTLSANVSHAEQIKVDYQRETDSYGRLFVQFSNPIGKAISPPWAEAS